MCTIWAGCSAARLSATSCSSSRRTTSSVTTTIRCPADGADRAGARRQLQPDAHSRRVRQFPIPARIFDPFNVVQEGPDLYRRVEIPNATIPNPDPFALRILGFYPLPNRTPDDVYNLNNYESTIHQTVRRYSSNNRVDLRLGNHSLYGSGGISYAEIMTPRPSGITVQWRGRPSRGQEPVRPDRRRVRPEPVDDHRRALWPEPHQYEGFQRRQDGIRRLRSFGVPANLGR